MEQYTRKFNLEIIGIPENSECSAEQAIINLATALEVDIDSDDIDIAHRMNVKKKDPRPIIVRFSSYKAKQSLYKAKKKLRNTDLSSTFGPETGSVYINENLTLKRRKLFG